MVSKVSRSKVREEKHRRMRRHIIGTLKDLVWQCSEATTICMFRLLMM